MKKFKYIALGLTGLLFASCMGADYADPDDSIPPYGNNSIIGTNIISIDSLKNIKEYANAIDNNGYKLIDQDIQIKGIVTGNDKMGNIYKEISLQDKTGAILIRVNQGGLFATLPVGQEVLINLKDLYIGGYGKQAQLGLLYNGSVGYIDRYSFNKFYRLMGNPDKDKAEALAEEFDLNKVNDETYLKKNAGKLMYIKNVAFSDANGKNTYAPKGGDRNVNRGLKNAKTSQNISTSNLVVRTSTYAKFANEVLPSGSVDITGIFTRFNKTFQILLRGTDSTEICPSLKPFLTESFGESQGQFSIDNIALSEGVDHVWAWASAQYGMKASANISKKNYATQSRLVSPAIDLSKAKGATLTFDQAGKFFSTYANDCKVQVSTDLKNWTDLTVSEELTGQNWNFVTTTCDLKPYVGKTIYIGFLYTSTAEAAATWEIKNVTVE